MDVAERLELGNKIGRMLFTNAARAIAFASFLSLASSYNVHTNTNSALDFANENAIGDAPARARAHRSRRARADV